MVVKTVIWTSDKLKDIKMGSEGEYGKYPTIILQFGNTEITFPVNEESFGKLQRFFKLAEVIGSRGYEPHLPLHFDFNIWKK